MKNLILFLLISLLFPEIYAQNPINIVDKNQPIKEIQYFWNNRRNLDILVTLNCKKVKNNEIKDPYILPNDLEMILTANGYNWNKEIMSNQLLPKRFVDDNNNPIPECKMMFTLKNEHLNKLEFGHKGYNDPIRGNLWTKFIFNFEIEKDNNPIKLFKFPLYKNERSIDSKLSNQLKLTETQTTFFKNEIIVKFDSNLPDFNYFNVTIVDPKSNIEIANFDQNKSVKIGQNLVAYLKIKIAGYTMINDGYYNIMIHYNGKEKYPLPNKKFTEIKDYELESIRFTSGKNIEKKWDKIPEFNMQKIKIKVETNGNDFNDATKLSFDAVKLPINKSKSNCGKLSPFNLTNGNGEFDLDLSKCNEDGLYQLRIKGNVKNSQNPNQIVNLKMEDMFFFLNTKNTIRSLRFIYDIDKVVISFGLDRIVESDLVKIVIESSDETVTTNVSTSYDEKQKVYITEIKDYKKNNFNKFEIVVSKNPIFDFSFKVIDEKILHDAIKKAIVDNLPENGKKVKLALKDGDKKKEIIEKIKAAVKTTLISQDDKTSSKDQKSFFDQIENLITKEVDKIASQNKRDLDKDSTFWGSTFGKVTQFVGNLALRYLGIVIEPTPTS